VERRIISHESSNLSALNSNTLLQWTYNHCWNRANSRQL
jgi:hypothetical protein